MKMASLQGIYVALFGRPADPAGLAHWLKVTKDGSDLTELVDVMGALPEASARFDGLSPSQIVNLIFQSLFGRDADADGLAHFVAKLESGEQSIASIAINVLDGAQGNDLTIITNKIAAADAWTRNIDTSEEVSAYSGTNAAEVGRAFVQLTTADESTVPDNAQAQEAINALLAPSGGQTPADSSTGGGSDGQTPDDEADQTFVYDEVRLASDILGTVDLPTDVTIGAITITGGNEDGFFTVDIDGQITLTEAGLASAANDFETGENSFRLDLSVENDTNTEIEQLSITLAVQDVLEQQTVSLANIGSGVGGFKIVGDTPSDFFGSSVSSGDFNGDGIDDVIIGAKGAEPEGDGRGLDHGNAYIVFGNTNLNDISAPLTAGDIAQSNGDLGIEITPNTGRGNFGATVSSAGDFNNDEIDDILIGAPLVNSAAGSAHLIYGKAELTNIDLSTTNNVVAFEMSGDGNVDYFGTSVTHVGDFNMDGIDDFAVTTLFGDGPTGVKTGNVSIIFGTQTTPGDFAIGDLATNAGITLFGEDSQDRAGFSISRAGDINADGIPDIIIGAMTHNVSGAQSAGAAYIVYGKANPTDMNLKNIVVLQNDFEDNIGGFKISGQDMSDRVGESVSAAGDVNGDGVDDVIIGAPYVDGETISSGAAFIVFGSSADDGLVGNLSIGDISNGVNGIKISGENELDLVGEAVSSAGDFNKDGYDDVLISGEYDDAGGDQAGAVYLVFGGPDLVDIDLSNIAAGIGGFKIIGEDTALTLGNSVAAAGDLNNDGYGDLIVGSAGYGLYPETPGAAYVIFGSNAWDTVA